MQPFIRRQASSVLSTLRQGSFRGRNTGDLEAALQVIAIIIHSNTIYNLLQ